MRISLALLASACDVTLAREQSAPQSEQLIAQLNRAGVAATRTREGATDRYRIEVANAAVERAFSAVRAAPDTPASQEDANDDAPLIQSQSEQQQRLARHLASELARSIELLPNVILARVHLRLPSTVSSFPEDTQKAAASLLILQRREDPSIAEQARALMLGTVPELSAGTIRIVQSLRPTPTEPAVALTHLGPITVTEQSAGTLKLCLAIALAIHMLLAAALLWLLRKRRLTMEHD